MLGIQFFASTHHNGNNVDFMKVLSYSQWTVFCWFPHLNMIYTSRISPSTLTLLGSIYLRNRLKFGYLDTGLLSKLIYFMVSFRLSWMIVSKLFIRLHDNSNIVNDFKLDKPSTAPIMLLPNLLDLLYLLGSPTNQYTHWWS